jgi:hypothetical protein
MLRFQIGILADISNVETVIADFEIAPAKDRRAFAAAVLLRKR